MAKDAGSACTIAGEGEANCSYASVRFQAHVRHHCQRCDRPGARAGLVRLPTGSAPVVSKPADNASPFDGSKPVGGCSNEVLELAVALAVSLSGCSCAVPKV